eukprot:gene3336-2318_t
MLLVKLLLWVCVIGLLREFIEYDALREGYYTFSLEALFTVFVAYVVCMCYGKGAFDKRETVGKSTITLDKLSWFLLFEVQETSTLGFRFFRGEFVCAENEVFSNLVFRLSFICLFGCFAHSIMDVMGCWGFFAHSVTILLFVYILAIACVDRWNYAHLKLLFRGFSVTTVVMGSLGWMSVGGLTLSYRLVYCMYFRCCDLLVCDIGCMYNFGFTGVSGLKISSRLIVGVDYYYMCMRWWIYNINLFAVTSQIQFLRVGDALRFGGLLVHFIGIYSIVGGFSPDLFVDRFIVKVVTYVMNWFVAMSLFYGCSACEKDLRDFLDSIVACMLILDASLHVHEFVGGWEAFCKGLLSVKG